MPTIHGTRGPASGPRPAHYNAGGSNSAEKSKAEQLAHVDGIVRVDNQMEVGSKGVESAISDTVLTTKGDDILKRSDISVTTNNGVAILTGTVASDAASQHATSVAQQADGVKTVSNKLRVTPDGK